MNDDISEIFRTRVRLPAPPPITKGNMMFDDEKKVVVKQGKPWTSVATFNVYEEALTLKLKLLEEKPNYQAKIKLSSSGYVVKTRLHPDFEPKKEKKKSGKSRKRNKKNSNRAKFDASASI